jgi:hypothetical protein
MGIWIGNIWHLRLGLGSQPGGVFSGTDPAELFRSADGGLSWASVDGINRHRLRPFWRPVPSAEQGVMEVREMQGEEAAQNDRSGMTHSIESDPRDPSRMYIAITYVTSDSGASWGMFQHQPEPVEAVGEALISQTEANVASAVDPAAHFDMHTMRLDPKNPDRFWE